MRKLAICILLLSILGCTCNQEDPSAKKPRLVIGIVIDQMKMEYLHRYNNKFGDGGFKRLLEKGHVFKNAHYNYVPTYTAPGHASIYTGTTPANHGIIGNNWYSREKDQSIYCVSDLSESAVGGSERSGRISPRNLITSTITDELRVSSNFRSKVVGISLKDRGAVLPAGHNPTGAFWFDDNTAEFMSSSYYYQELPNWVTDFNNQRLPASYMDLQWNTMLPIDQYIESSVDENQYERKFKGKEDVSFPYNLSEIVESEGIDLIKTTPYGNSIIVDFALAAVEGENLGEGIDTDFLAVSFSTTDYVGHAFGPNSIEVQDTYLRLDLDLKRFFDHLDSKFDGNYLVFLTADHGVAAVPQYQIDNKMPGGYYNNVEVGEQFIKETQRMLGKGDWILDVSNDQVFLNRPYIIEKGLEVREVQQKVASIALNFPFIQEVFIADDIAKRNGSSLSKNLIDNGYNTKRSGDVMVSKLPGYLSEDWGKQGTTHGSGNTYDTHIPIIFYGSNISQGTSVRRVHITDIAPTVSMLLNISLPSNSTGEPLVELFD